MSPAKYSIFLGAALLLSSCADDMLRTDAYDDGSISFSVDQATPSLSSRGGGDKTPTLSYISSAKISSGEKPLWLHLEAAENPASSNLLPKTRALPVSLDDLKEFMVTATLPDNGGVFIDDQAVTKKTDTSWETSTTYFWPLNDALTFFCTPSDPSLPETLTNLERTSSSLTFNYTVPFFEEGNTDADTQPDFIMAIHSYSRADVTNGVAPIDFRHPLAGICFIEDESIDDEKLHIAKIELSGLYGAGSCEFNGKKGLYGSNWTLDKSVPHSYIQTVSPGADGVEVPVDPSKTVKAVANPFMVIPHKKADLTDFKVKVTLADNSFHEVSLAGIDGLEPGKMYVFTLSGLDAKYPPVNNLKGMAGYGTVSLTWDNPESTYKHIHQCGVTIKITQIDTKGDNDPVTVIKSIRWEDSHEEGRYPDPDKDEKLDLFADIKNGFDEDGNFTTINTRIYDEFKCDVYADYYNTEDNDYETNPKIWQSIARTITIKPGISFDKVLFYIPEGAGSPEGLKDDDDLAAWDWFKNTYSKGEYATADNLAEKKKQGFSVLWVPCGVNLRGSGDGDGFATYLEDYDQGTATSRISTVNEVLNTLPDALTKAGSSYYQDYKDNYENKLMMGSRVTGCYNYPKDGTIKIENVGTYFTKKDINAIREFYGNGGNLLLTTFSIELVYEFGVIPFDWYRTKKEEMRPYYHLFNEVKPSSTWFVRADFDNHNSNNHPLYKDMFKCKPRILNIQIEGYTANTENPYIACGNDYDVEMFPLLSLGADACENNNVVWNFKDGQENLSMSEMENGVNGKFLGTWGQIGDESIGVVMEFYPGCTTTREMRNDCFENLDKDEQEMGRDWIWGAFSKHGRCIAIGLGAYEFNNGMRYTPGINDFEVKNYYQSNVHKMTQNALNYLMTADPTKTDPTK